MGEQDLGVWFASSSLDPLNHYKLIQEAIGRVKQYRHGVPFGAYTSGVNISSDVPPLQEIGLDSVQVSLIAANPNDYAQATGLSSTEATKAFGQVCGYCVTLHESGFPSIKWRYCKTMRLRHATWRNPLVRSIRTSIKTNTHKRHRLYTYKLT
jgi:hypothetical protein